MKLFLVFFAFVLSVKATSKPSGIYFDNGKKRRKYFFNNNNNNNNNNKKIRNKK